RLKHQAVVAITKWSRQLALPFGSVHKIAVDRDGRLLVRKIGQRDRTVERDAAQQWSSGKLRRQSLYIDNLRRDWVSSGFDQQNWTIVQSLHCRVGAIEIELGACECCRFLLPAAKFQRGTEHFVEQELSNVSKPIIGAALSNRERLIECYKTRGSS